MNGMDRTYEVSMVEWPGYRYLIARVGHLDLSGYVWTGLVCLEITHQPSNGLCPAML